MVRQLESFSYDFVLDFMKEIVWWYGSEGFAAAEHALQW